MELTRYAQIIGRWWYVALVAFAATMLTTVVWLDRQPLVYESDGTFVVRPRTGNREQSVRAFDTLVRGVEINATYAAIARSGMIRERATRAMDDDLAGAELSVRSELVTGTNLLELAVTGENPRAAHQLAMALSKEVITYVDGLQDAFVLAPLDPPDEPRTPVSPRRPLVLMMGAALALALAVGVPMGVEYVVRGFRRDGAGRLDHGVLDEAGMRRMLRIAVERAGASGQRLAFVVVHPSHGGEPEDVDDAVLPAPLPESLRARLAQLVQVGVLRNGTVVAAIVEPGVEGLRRRLLSWYDDDRAEEGTDGRFATAICLYGSDEVSGDADAVQLLDHLTGTGETYEDAHLFLSSGEPDGARP